MEEYLVNSQIEERAEKYDLRPGMGMAAIQLGIPKRYLTIVHEVDDEVFDSFNKSVYDGKALILDNFKNN